MAGRMKPPVFLERRLYRKRRMADAARLLPILGIVLFGVPMLWLPRPGAGDGAGDATALTSLVIAYIFGIWVLLVALSALLSASLASQEADDDDPGEA